MTVKYTGPEATVKKQDDEGRVHVWNETNKHTTDVPDEFGQRLVDSSGLFEEVSKN